MKSKFILILLAVFCFSETNAQYDKALADSLGADAYGMKLYYLVLLKTGKAEVKDDATKEILFRGHMDNISRLTKAGKLIVAGPLGENADQYRGIFIFTAGSEEEVEQYLKEDPAIKAGIFDTQIYSWYGSAALPSYIPLHNRIASQQH